MTSDQNKEETEEPDPQEIQMWSYETLRDFKIAMLNIFKKRKVEMESKRIWQMIYEEINGVEFSRSDKNLQVTDTHPK